MRLSDAAHTSRPWRVHTLAPDFRLEDVWALPTPGRADDFPVLVRTIAGFDPARDSSLPVRSLFAIRLRIGELLGWDRPHAETDASPPTLRDRLPDDLRPGASGPLSSRSSFSPLYLTHDECALEIVNRTVHGVLHLGWVPDTAGGYRGQMAILVKPNGALGSLYMAAIAPVRHAIVYPQLMRDIERRWQASASQRGAARTGQRLSA